MAGYTTNTITVDGINIFYRSTGPQTPNTPVLVLLHGFPSSSHQYRNLIPLISTLSNNKYRILAPDLPGFGFTSVPQSLNYTYTFNNLTTTVESFLDALQISKFSIYVFDYGAPVGFRLALKRPNAIQAIITQNGNAYEEGLGSFWDPLKEYWKTGAEKNREILRGALSLSSIESQYYTGTSPTSLIPPESPYLDHALLSRPGNADIQLDLFYDYRTNVSLYPEFQRFFREEKVPILAVWGRNDVIFLEEGAKAFKRDAGERAEVILLDAGHFAVESHTGEIAEIVVRFLGGRGL